MKKVLLPLLAFLTVVLWAVEPDLRLDFQPASISVKSLKAASFDPAAPWQQPSLTTLWIRNESPRNFRVQMKVELLWNGLSETLIAAEFISNEALPAGGQFPPLSNRDLVTNQSSTHFTRVGNSNFSLTQLSRSNPILRDAIEAGYLPDGVFTIRVFAKPQSEVEDWNSATSASFDLEVKNDGVITLLSPGAPAPAQPVKVDENPVNFIWNIVATGYNRRVLTILEFPENLPPRPENLAQTGIRFFQTDVLGDQFSEFLPFKPGNYYAWQMWTRGPQYNYPQSRIWQDPEPGDLVSAWNLFQYTAPSAEEDHAERIITKLRNLDEADLETLFIQGFKPTGEVIWQGKSYSGRGASDLIDMFSDKKYRVTIQE